MFRRAKSKNTISTGDGGTTTRRGPITTLTKQERSESEGKLKETRKFLRALGAKEFLSARVERPDLLNALCEHSNGTPMGVASARRLQMLLEQEIGRALERSLELLGPVLRKEIEEQPFHALLSQALHRSWSDLAHRASIGELAAKEEEGSAGSGKAGLIDCEDLLLRVKQQQFEELSRAWSLLFNSLAERLGAKRLDLERAHARLQKHKYLLQQEEF